ncbi:DNA-binding protein [Streptomyces sp. NBC_01789]|uniref:DNA-binding protein n=1 Tax=Streptomyces sp. NBC_01789 TaxID=2975941 RepID=UPI00225C3363|nr:DNA-binding protein [Streptomyces sp. NBC_01789]MCX4450691.1 helix-turn-helix domain-containing protein [Streptomyces sp. NBC_01789]
MPSTALVTAADMAYWTGRPIGTIWRWASEGRITVHGHGKAARYDLMEVEPAKRDADTHEIKAAAPAPPIKERPHAHAA